MEIHNHSRIARRSKNTIFETPHGECHNLALFQNGSFALCRTNLDLGDKRSGIIWPLAALLDRGRANKGLCRAPFKRRA
jgi:hypothetical protein